MLDKTTCQVLKILEDNGHEAYLVGGSVRDHLLKRASSDLDITTDAKPSEMIKIFKDYKVIPTGLKHGTITLIIDKRNYEITTYRHDDNYHKHRFPKSVSFISNVKEDVKRRDFTINGLLMDKNEKIYDHVGGLKDLENKIIKAIGDPDKRFKEDALRILRAIRFKAVLNFTIEENTQRALLENKSLLKFISKERYTHELLLILNSKHPENLLTYQAVFKELFDYDYDERIKDTKEIPFKLALLFKRHPEELTKLALSKKEIKALSELVENSDVQSDEVIAVFSRIQNKDLYLKYLSFLKREELIKAYRLNKDYIVNNATLALDYASLKDKDIDIKALKEELIGLIQTKKLKNDKQDIKKYLERCYNLK